MKKLKPCPFCGGAPVMRYTAEKYEASQDGPAGEFVAAYHVECHECGVSLTDEYEADVRANWNRRK